MGKLKLEEGKHFSRAGLAKWMNENCPPKEREGSEYTARDIQQYAIRGYMPERCGKHTVKEIKNKYMGVFVEVTFKK